MAYCVDCGKNLDENEKFCRRCGKSSSGTDAMAPVRPKISWNPLRNNPILKLGIVVASALLILFIARVAGVIDVGLPMRDDPAEANQLALMALQQGRYDDFVKMLDSSISSQFEAMDPRKRDMVLRSSFNQLNRKYCGSASISSFESKTVEFGSDIAKVKTVFRCSDGSQNDDGSDPTKLRQVDGRWLLTQ